MNSAQQVFFWQWVIRVRFHRKGDEIVFEKCMPIGVTMDERIASGAYFAMAFRKMRTYLRNPELLEVAPTDENIE